MLVLLFPQPTMQHNTIHCTGIGLWEFTGHRFITKAALEDPKDPPRGHEDGRAATYDGHRVGRVMLFDVKCPLDGCP